MKRRDRQRENRRIKEERLNRTTEWGSADPTARQAVDNIIAEEKAMLRAELAKERAARTKAGKGKRAAESSPVGG